MARLCKLCKLPPELRDVIDDMLDQGLTGGAVQAYLEDHGVDVSVSAISRHRITHLGLLRRDFNFVGMPQNDAPEALSLTEYSRRMSGYLQALSLNQARYVQDRQEAFLQSHEEPDIDRPVSVLTRLVTLANMFMGFASTASLDAAIETLRAAGYQIQGMGVEQNNLPNYEEWVQWKANK
jgi:hypothetical protein